MKTGICYLHNFTPSGNRTECPLCAEDKQLKQMTTLPPYPEPLHKMPASPKPHDPNSKFCECYECTFVNPIQVPVITTAVDGGPLNRIMSGKPLDISAARLIEYKLKVTELLRDYAPAEGMTLEQVLTHYRDREQKATAMVTTLEQLAAKLAKDLQFVLGELEAVKRTGDDGVHTSTSIMLELFRRYPDGYAESLYEHKLFLAIRNKTSGIKHED